MRLICPIILVTVLLTGCAPDPEEILTPEGTRIILLEPGDGERPDVGDISYFHMITRNQRDSSLFDTRDGEGEMHVEQVVSPSPRDAQSIRNALSYLPLGSRAIVEVDLKAYPSLPPGLSQDSVARCEIEVMDILSPKEHAARRATSTKNSR